MIPGQSNIKNKENLHPIELDGNSLSIEQLDLIAKGKVQILLSEGAKKQVLLSREQVDKALASEKAIYGITTGFGKFKDIYIESGQRLKLQENLVLSHAAGVGPVFDIETTRLMMVLRANALAKGFSGVRLELLQLLIDCVNNKLHPLIPEQGSLGASGDLAPLSHLALLLIGRGQVEFNGKIRPAADVLKEVGLKPALLEAKEGLALTNGTQAMTAMAVGLILEAEYLAKLADIVGSMSLEAQLGSVKAFSEKIHNIRPHKGQIDSASNLRRLLKDSALVASHVNCLMVQDAYSLRCMPQVHGASRQAIAHARDVISIEINSATDNPLVFEDEILSGGNFHGQPLALVLDYLGIAISELANISERRIERLVNPYLSNGLPAFLTLNGGTESGMMIAQYTAAALVSENKVLAHPASVDSIPTSANQEDHVSMGACAGRKARQILNNAKHVLAIELLCAAQALDIRINMENQKLANQEISGANHEIKVESTEAIMFAHKTIRQEIPFWSEDRELYLDIAKAGELVQSHKIVEIVESVIGPLA